MREKTRRDEKKDKGSDVLRRLGMKWGAAESAEQGCNVRGCTCTVRRSFSCFISLNLLCSIQFPKQILQSFELKRAETCKRRKLWSLKNILRKRSNLGIPAPLYNGMFYNEKQWVNKLSPNAAIFRARAIQAYPSTRLHLLRTLDATNTGRLPRANSYESSIKLCTLPPLCLSS